MTPSVHLPAAPQNAVREAEIARVQDLFDHAQAKYRQNPQDPEAAWQFGRACFQLADLKVELRLNLAQQGTEACRRALQPHPSAAAHYYLALNLGQMAKVQKWEGLKLVNQMEDQFKSALALDPNFDYAGPHLWLGVLYREAPGWPLSIGSRSQAHLHISKAVELAPEYPENWLTLLESEIKWGERAAAEDRLSTVQEKLANARQKFTGIQWAEDWQEWDRRWDRICSKLAQPRHESPRGKQR